MTRRTTPPRQRGRGAAGVVCLLVVVLLLHGCFVAVEEQEELCYLIEPGEECEPVASAKSRLWDDPHACGEISVERGPIVTTNDAGLTMCCYLVTRRWSTIVGIC